MRFRLLECDQCHRRGWYEDDDQPAWVKGTCVLGEPDRKWVHDWVERFTFFAEDNGPGLHPTQTGAEVNR